MPPTTTTTTMPSPSGLQQRQWWVSSRKLAEKHLGHARQLMATQEPADIFSALSLVEAALKLYPQWEKALELKARALLYLRRFKDVAYMLHDYIPSLKFQTYVPESPGSKETVKLLSNGFPEEKSKKRSLLKCFSFAKLRRTLASGLSRKSDKDHWRYLVLGQACCHLGMMEDAMILLQSGKKAASAAFRKQSNCMREDGFYFDNMNGSEFDLVSQLLGNIKFLLRRRTAALAALEAGLYSESVRHFSKIVDGRRGTPQGFIAECYVHRAIAFQAAGRVADAIADWNRTLALNPVCAEALGARASLFEMTRCFSESLQDLERLRMLYEAVLLQQRLPESGLGLGQSPSNMDLQGNLDRINSKILATRQRLGSHCTLDHHLLLGLPRGCSRADVERAFLLISLKHRPDKASHFIDRCEFVDDRDIEAVKDEARSSALRLFRLLQRAYSGLLSLIVDEEAQKKKDEADRQLCEQKANAGSSSLDLTVPELESFSGLEGKLQIAGGDDLELGRVGQERAGEGEAKSDQESSAMAKPNMLSASILDGSCSLIDSGFREEEEEEEEDDEDSRESDDPVTETFSGFSSFGSITEELGILDATVFSSASTCREVANVGVIISQALAPEPWMKNTSTAEWSHAAHTPPPLSVT